MKAAFIEKYGNEDNIIIGELADPTPSTGQVRIRVKAAGINPVDWIVRNGDFATIMNHSLPLVVGWDAAGTIESLGDGVAQQHPELAVGQDVYVHSPIDAQGAYAEYLVVGADLVAPKPASLNYSESAAVPLAALTAWQALFDHGKLEQGQRVLIHNAAGGVGGFLVQLAKHFGAYVIGTASAAKADYVKKLGADEIIDYRSQAFDEAVKDVDLVVAAVGGDDVLNRSLKVIKPGGYLVSLLDEMPEEEAEAADVHYTRMMVSPNADQLTRIGTLIDQGKITVRVDKVFPLAETKEAHLMSQSRRVTGKLVLEI